MTKTATELFIEYYALKPAERINSTVQDYVFNHQQERIDELQRQLDTANFFRNGDSATINNATQVIDEMRGRINELEKEISQYKNLINGLKSVFGSGVNKIVNPEELRGEHE